MTPCPSGHPMEPVGVRKANGDQVARWWCERCGKTMGDDIGPAGDLPITIDAIDRQPCARCGSTQGVELHHWAPRQFFGLTEADKWPQSYLCPGCHRHWHKVLRDQRPLVRKPTSEVPTVPEDHSQVRRFVAERMAHGQGSITLRGLRAVYTEWLTGLGIGKPFPATVALFRAAVVAGGYTIAQSPEGFSVESVTLVE